MVSKFPNWGHSPSKWPKWHIIINVGYYHVAIYLLTGMILQVTPLSKGPSHLPDLDL